MKNIWLKLLAVFIAIFCRYVVTTDVKIASITIPIELKNIPDNLILISSVEQLKLKISGPRFLISEVIASTSPLPVIIPDGAKNRVVLPVDLNQLKLPASVSVLAIDPPEVELEFDTKIEKIVEVVVPKLGQLNRDYTKVNSSVLPSKVLLNGPSSELKDVKVIETFPVDLATIVSDTSKKLTLRGLSKQIQSNVDSVTWDIQVNVVSERRSFKLPIAIPDGFQGEINPTMALVTFEGKRSRVRSIGSSEFKLFFNDSGRDIESTNQLVVDAPDDLNIISVYPQTVQVIRSTRKPLQNP